MVARRIRLLLLPLLLLGLCSHFGAAPAGASRGHHKSKSKPSPRPAPPPPRAPAAATFDVVSFGAKGDGLTDDTKAFEASWAAACKQEGSTVVVPSGHVFLVGQISFAGPCKPNIIFQLDGTIVAPTSPKAWRSGTLQWLEFRKLAQGITIRGDGVIEGKGSAWWPSKSHLISENQTGSQLEGKMPGTRPTAVRFYGSYNVIVTGIQIRNSAKCHLKFDNCEAVQVFNLSVSSPGDSPNTDGIHLQNSANVVIHDVDLSCGDDCISIQTGCSAVYVHDVRCGPGHGISIGGLGMDGTKACVSNVTVRGVTLSNTMTGVRIKTWQGGSGSVRNIRFSDIVMKDVRTAITIDQFYCDGGRCRNQSSAVAVSDVYYTNIRGTYTDWPVYLACSDSVPCLGISLADVELEAAAAQDDSRGHDPFCWQAYGKLQAPTVPPIRCLKSNKSVDNWSSSTTEYSC
ncbi:polygalacturonase-like [Iris pallida]|uniref:endo-polygalacturonase n=1 Tax=Iris pallida TaxID=29817 RepID=A0AAX6HWU6_IRIPA|nr:polygalacturonase-like [Iris pallida]